MKKKKLKRPSPAAAFIALTALAAMLAMFWPSAGGPEEAARRRPKVGATIFPLYDIARNVAGDEMEVILISPPGASPHTFELRPSDLRKLKDATAIYAIGHGLDDWVADLASASGADTVIVDRGIVILQSAEEGGDDPHYWLDPDNAARIAGTVAEDLAGRFPDSFEALQRNLDAYLEQLRRADAAAAALLADLPSRDIVTLHDAWYYFSRAYDLNVAGTFEPTAGREPTPQYLAALQAAVAASRVRTIYAEPQLDTMSLRPFARDNGLTIAVLDPAGGTAGRDSYIKTLLYNADTIGKNQR